MGAMQKPALSWSKEKDRIREARVFVRVHQIICLVCLSVILTLTTYSIVAAILGHIDVVGATLVDVEVPSPEVFPIYAKPVSFLMIAGLGLTFSGLELAKPRLAKTSDLWMSIFKLAAFLGISLAAYEVLYNFAIWTADLARDALLGIVNPDVATNQFPNSQTPWNLVFATKLTMTVLAIAVYCFYVLRQVERKKEAVPVPKNSEIST